MKSPQYRWPAAAQTLHAKNERPRDARPAIAICNRDKKPKFVTRDCWARTRALLGLKKFERALADNLQANTLQPGDPDTLNNIGACLQSLGRKEEALVWFDSPRSNVCRTSASCSVSTKPRLR